MLLLSDPISVRLKCPVATQHADFYFATGGANRLYMGDGAAGFTEVNSGDAILSGGASCHTLAVDLNGDGVRCQQPLSFSRRGPSCAQVP